jgi:FkbM family methyltransferase
MLINSFKLFLNKLIAFTGYKISSLKYIYDSESNLIKSINFFKIKSVIDVGANEGQFVLKLLRKGFKGNILSFEPLTVSHKKLLLNAKKNKKIISWSVAEKCGLGSNNFSDHIFVSRHSESSSLLKILPKHTNLKPLSKIISTEKINIKKLDNFYADISKLKKNIFLKIDTQGYEMEVLKGATKTLKLITGLIVEVSLVKLYEKQPLWLDIVNFLKKRNFIVWSVDRVMGNIDTGETYQLDVTFAKKNEIFNNNKHS